ncbi:hypothetical protein TA3x_000962 [Tundrisphaera sp. TA3]|uniref:hypothetical protein n=1 Tax=Tundrisphaera sp. TA3 TaxID=3435775 RepID=UPI003EBED96E
MIGRIAKKAGKVLWKAMSPIRRPLKARVDAYAEQMISNTVNARMMPILMESLAGCGHRLERIEASLGSAHQAASAIADEMDLVLGGLSREVFRLQARVEELHWMASTDRRTEAGLSLLGEVGEDEPMCRPISQERAMVG